MKLIFATNNKHKVEEVRAALGDSFDIVTLAEAGLHGEIPETADTLQGNALQKATWVWERVRNSECGVRSFPSAAANSELRSPNSELFGVFADDTGLEVDALGGAPGVYSARYAGEHCTFDDNINKLLQALDGQTNRRACFRTVICLLRVRSAECGVQSCPSAATDSELRGVPSARPTTPNSALFFEGRVDGQILTERHSNGEGFGYDPVFMPDRFAVSFAEMPLEVKNSISHRGLAVAKLVNYLKK